MTKSLWFQDRLPLKLYPCCVLLCTTQEHQQLQKAMAIRKVLSRIRRIRDVGSNYLRCYASYSTVARQIEVERARSQQEENKRWAQEPGARDVLAQPPFDEIAVDTPSMLDSLENYLKVRHHLGHVCPVLCRPSNSRLTFKM